MNDSRPLEEQLGCFGYYGFGGGYAAAKWGTADDTQGAMYCSARCACGQRCWDRHRDRVRALFPDLTQLADEIAQTHKGHAYMTEWLKQTEQFKERFVEPYTTVLAGNTQDGMSVALTGHPQSRGSSSLAWPLVPLGVA